MGLNTTNGDRCPGQNGFDFSNEKKPARHCRSWDFLFICVAKEVGLALSRSNVNENSLFLSFSLKLSQSDLLTLKISLQKKPCQLPNENKNNFFSGTLLKLSPLLSFYFFNYVFLFQFTDADLTSRRGIKVKRVLDIG